MIKACVVDEKPKRKLVVVLRTKFKTIFYSAVAGFELRSNSTSLYPMPNNLLTEEKIVYAIYLKFNKVIRYLYVCLNLKIQIF